MFHAKLPHYSNDPIPEEFKFPSFDLYVRPIKYELAPDPIFLNERLVPYYEDIVNQLTPVINQLLSDIHTLEQKITHKLDEQPIRYKFNFLNADLWRKFNTLLGEFNKIKNNLLVSRLSIMERRVELLMRINNLATYLAEHPKYFYINIIHVNQSWKSLEFDYLSSLYLQFKAIKLSIRDIEQQLPFIPHPFSKPEENVDMFNHLIQDAIQTVDPLTGYIPASDTYDTFYFFLTSRHSPVRFPKNYDWKPINYTKSFNYIMQKLTEFSNIQPNTQEYQILQSYTSTYIFEMLCLIDRNNSKCQKLDNAFYKNSLKPVKKVIKNPSYLSPDEQEMTPPQLFKSITMLSGLIGECITATFESNPVDVLFHIQKANLALILELLRRTKKSMEDLKISQELKSFWELLLSATQSSGICSTIKFTEQWLNIQSVPDEFKSAAKVPLELIN